MSEIIDKVKGKAKQIEGAITGDKTRQLEGALDEAKGNVKGVVNKVESRVHDAVDAVKRAAPGPLRDYRATRVEVDSNGRRALVNDMR